MFAMARSVVLLSILVGLAGCGSPAPPAGEGNDSAAQTDAHEDHAHDQHEGDDSAPASLDAAIDQLRQQNASLEKCFADKKDLEEADSIVHEIGHTLEHISEFIKKLPEGEQSVLKKPLEALFERFGKLDEDIHAGEEVKYSEISEPIATDISALEEHVKH
ncbi:MAG: hypothetical protein DWQ37_06400 [Planctomycetota bacterium]|nr:MAG: hypothetical protein DWQ37_06400 [Planctomycetota bacterium]